MLPLLSPLLLHQRVLGRIMCMCLCRNNVLCGFAEETLLLQCNMGESIMRNPIGNSNAAIPMSSSTGALHLYRSGSGIRQSSEFDSPGVSCTAFQHESSLPGQSMPSGEIVQAAGAQKALWEPWSRRMSRASHTSAQKRGTMVCFQNPLLCIACLSIALAVRYSCEDMPALASSCVDGVVRRDNHDSCIHCIAMLCDLLSCLVLSWSLCGRSHN
jgi:hypothetical protein